MTDRELLEKRYKEDRVSANDLAFGRVMSFGRYKGQFIYYLLVKHWRYMNWVIENTDFCLTETEKWWKMKIDTCIECYKADRLIYGLAGVMGSVVSMENENNPHFMVE